MRFILALIAGLLLFNSWPVIEKQLDLENQTIIKSIKTEIDTVKENTDLSTKLNTLAESLNKLKAHFNSSFELQPEETQDQDTLKAKKPELSVPTKQTFSVSNIEIGLKKAEVEQLIGAPVRSSLNEYGTHWHTYHENYQNFLMIAYDHQNSVAGIYTNQDLLSSANGIKHGSSKELVFEQFGHPLDKIQKGLAFYQLQKDRDFDLFHLDDSYVSIFYDKHQNNIVTAIQIISDQLEQQRNNYYTDASRELKEGFEYQLFDLTNAARVQEGLPVLGWDETVRKTARSHSVDMAENNYFDHTNLAGQSPFDRMAEDDIPFSVAGENLAYGQTSSVFAHEGLMNSLGHRENILKANFKLLGVGVAFNSKSQPYYTENFYTKRM